MKAVILAGGKGTRLRPYTTTFPKPLMPVGGRPIIEIIIKQLKKKGIEDLIISVSHLRELIMAFLNNGSKWGVNIKYALEEQPLGTAGGLGLFKEELKDTFLMINGDTLTNLDFSRLVSHHRRGDAVATIALKKRPVYVDFGVVETDENGFITGYIEKPTMENLVSMGVYVFEPEVLAHIRPGEKLDFPELINLLLASRKKIRGFVFDGYWLDIGRPEDYEKAEAEFEKINKTLNL